jgi:hypothetical protein
MCAKIWFASVCVLLAACSSSPRGSEASSSDPDAAVDPGAAEPTGVEDATSAAASDGANDATNEAAHQMTVPCTVRAPTACPEPPPRYADVLPIFEQRCIICHSGAPNGPWPLDGYEHIADWQDNIRSDMLDCSMPPFDAGVPITLEERMAILTWIRCGLPK